MKEYSIVCKFCGSAFITNVKNSKYCSKSCKSKQYRYDIAMCIKKTRSCDICGKEFIPRIFRRTTCSVECLNLKKEIIFNDTKKDAEFRKTKCPMCGKIYDRVFRPAWIGNGMPRIRCTNCYEHINNINFETFDQTSRCYV